MCFEKKSYLVLSAIPNIKGLNYSLSDKARDQIKTRLVFVRTLTVYLPGVLEELCLSYIFSVVLEENYVSVIFFLLL